MTVGVAAAMAAVAVMCYLRWRSWAAPPVLFAAYWASVTAASPLLRIGDHELSLGALLVFLVGVIAFAIGAGLADLIGGSVRARPVAPVWRLTPGRKRTIHLVIFLYSLALFALIPTFVRAVRAAGDVLGIDDFSMAARTALGLADRAGVPHYFQSATSVGSYFAYYAAWTYGGERLDKLSLLAATSAALAMSALTFARSPVVGLMVGILGILSLRGSVKPRTIALAVAGTATLAILLGVMLNKGPEFGTGKSTQMAITENLSVYFIGGPLGFSAVMDDPRLVGMPGLSLRFFLQFADWLRIPIARPESVLDYVASDLGNVYSFFFPYWSDGGWWGVIAASLVAGAVAAGAYRWARSGNPIGGAAYGLVLGGILTSSIGDGLFFSPVPWILLVALGVVLWRLPPLAKARPAHRAAA